MYGKNEFDIWQEIHGHKVKEPKISLMIINYKSTSQKYFGGSILGNLGITNYGGGFLA